MHWPYLIHIGDLPLTLSAAAAITVWMMSSRAWRLAFCWGLLFLVAIGIVAVSKIAFLIWGGLPPSYGFRALSGHAAGVTAVAVVLLPLLLRDKIARPRGAGIACGLLIGSLMGVLLVVCDEHSVAEAAGGWAIGALAGVGAVYLGGAPPASPPVAAMLGAGVIFIAGVILLRPLPIGYLMWRAARLVARHASMLAMVAS